MSERQRALIKCTVDTGNFRDFDRRQFACKNLANFWLGEILTFKMTPCLLTSKILKVHKIGENFLHAKICCSTVSI